MKLDFVTVTCSRDLELTKLQLKSFGKFLTNDIAYSITVVVNDANATVLKSQIQEFISSIPANALVRVLTYEEVVPAGTVADCLSGRAHWRDWYSAQVARLYVSKVLVSDYQVVLSSKDIFINKPRVGEFFINGKANIPALLSDPCERVLYHHWLACCELFKVDPLACSPAHAATPYVVSNNQMRQMIDSIDTQDKSLASIFYETIEGPEGKISYRPLFDLYLYAAWLHKNGLFYEIQNPDSICTAQQDLQSSSIIQIPPRFMKDNAGCRETWVEPFRHAVVDHAGLLSDAEFTDLIESFK